jgi:hypothetical protein
MCVGGGSKGLIGAIVGGLAAYATGGASLAVTGAAAAGASIGSSLDQKDAMAKAQATQDQANAQGLALATKTAADNKALQEKAISQQSQALDVQAAKQPNLYDIQNKNAMGAGGGISSTTLTGPQGVDPKTLLLGKTTLLGG